MLIVGGMGFGCIVRLNAVALLPAAFATWIVKANTPAVVGVPLILPDETASDKPAGRAPLVIVH